jgi:4-amino-4-deoxy-L-arabinose transferase-like glycosyltransferase
MRRKKCFPYLILSIFVSLSFIIKLILIIRYKNLLTLSSDDLNYIKSAVVLIKKGFFVFHNYNEHTVFIMPLYPVFLAAVFKVFGAALTGFQAVRIIQAGLSSLTIVFVYLISKKLFNTKIALLSAFLVSFYIPNIITPGYLLTETLFTALFYMLIYYSLKFSSRPSGLKFIILGVIWATTTLCRPTAALYPIPLFFYILVYIKPDIKKMFKMGVPMLLSFLVIMMPWWLRNYYEFGEFIPLALSSGNPMLQGTYIDYRQTPENIVYYKLGKNAVETDKTEVKVAKERIRQGFKNDFWRYLKWYTVGKTHLFWTTIFYWKEFFGIGQIPVLIYHYFLLTGFIGMFILMLKEPFKYILPVSVILYFNAVHCLYMAFDRYAFPLIPALTMFCAYFVFKSVGIYKSYKKPL